MTSNFYTSCGAALTSLREDWRTPPDLFASLHREFNFTVDAAATPANALLPRFWTRNEDAFAQDWRGERVFCNPPYGRDSGKWIALFSKWGRGGGASIVVALLPARTDTRAFHDYIWQKPNVEVRFLRGRLRFGSPDDGRPMSQAPFPSMIAVFNGR